MDIFNDLLVDEFKGRYTLKDALDNYDEMCKWHPTTYFYALGNVYQQSVGISNRKVIKYFKNYSNIILFDEKGRKYCRGRRLYEYKNSFWKNIWSKINRCRTESDEYRNKEAAR